jgi:hypothetical protein
MSIAMLALAGFPATAGFFGKVYLIEAAVDNGYAWLGVVIVVGSAVSLAYYLRVVAAVWMRSAAESLAVRRPAMAGGSPEADDEPPPRDLGGATEGGAGAGRGMGGRDAREPGEPGAADAADAPAPGARPGAHAAEGEPGREEVPGGGEAGHRAGAHAAEGEPGRAEAPGRGEAGDRAGAHAAEGEPGRADAPGGHEAGDWAGAHAAEGEPGRADAPGGHEAGDWAGAHAAGSSGREAAAGSGGGGAYAAGDGETGPGGRAAVPARRADGMLEGARGDGPVTFGERVRQPEVALVAVVCALATIAFGIYPDPVFDAARDAGAAITSLV